MSKLKALFLASALSLVSLSFPNGLEAKYQKKAAYEGYGKVSKKTGKVKTKTVSGYTKEDGTYVNPYAKSE